MSKQTREERLAAKKKYRQENRERIREKVREYYSSHKEECRARSRAYYRAHKDAFRVYARKYAQKLRENPDKARKLYDYINRWRNAKYLSDPGFREREIQRKKENYQLHKLLKSKEAA